jgi:hypothetical protein
MALIKVNWTPDQKQLRNFGIAGFFVFSLLGGLILWRKSIFGFALSDETASETAIGLIIAAFVCTILSVMAPGLLRPFYLGLTLITLPIGLVLSPLVMGFLYFGVFTPLGIAMRLTGWDPLERKLEPHAASYWIKREVKRTPASYFNQY